MTIEQTPHIIYTETDQNPQLNGEGATIPVIIGITGNTVSADKITLKKFKNLTAIKKTVENGGIGTDPSTNMSLKFIEDFLEETTKIYSDDLGLPYFYFIDMGKLAFSNGEAWTNAFNLAMTQRNAGKIAIVGFKKADLTKAITADEIAEIVGILESANRIIVEDSKKGKPKRVLFTVDGATDADLMKLTDDSQTHYIQKSRVLPCEPKHYAKIVARYCLTPYDREPGYYDFRSISVNDVIERTEDVEEDLMNAGINIVRKEFEGDNIHAKLCLGVSSAMAATPRPTDVLPHFRRNVDHLINRIYTTCYPQLKNNENKTYIELLQTNVDLIVEEEIEAGSMMEGTEIIVEESDINPYQILVKGSAYPVNSTLYIGIEMYIHESKVLAVETAL